MDPLVHIKSSLKVNDAKAKSIYKRVLILARTVKIPTIRLQDHRVLDGLLKRLNYGKIN